MFLRSRIIVNHNNRFKVTKPSEIYGHIFRVGRVQIIKKRKNKKKKIFLLKTSCCKSDCNRPRKKRFLNNCRFFFFGVLREGKNGYKHPAASRIKKLDLLSLKKSTSFANCSGEAENFCSLSPSLCHCIR